MRRRHFLQILGLLSVASLQVKSAGAGPLLHRLIPDTTERLPVVGLGTYQSFASLGDSAQQARLLKVLNLFAKEGGSVLDTSPMYSQAESVLGKLLPQLNNKPESGWFGATKVWIDGESAGRHQMASSSKKMGFPQLDLIQIHNLRDWKIHLRTLKEMKEAGKVRYIGATTWGGLKHTELEKVMKTGDLDFIQVSYNVVNRKVEKRLLPLAQDLGIGVIINRPFAQGNLFGRVKGRPLPNWVKSDADCQSWAQVMLKFVLGDPRVTLVIPATSKPKHLLDNMGAGKGALPSGKTRERIAGLFMNL